MADSGQVRAMRAYPYTRRIIPTSNPKSKGQCRGVERKLTGRVWWQPSLWKQRSHQICCRTCRFGLLEITLRAFHCKWDLQDLRISLYTSDMFAKFAFGFAFLYVFLISARSLVLIVSDVPSTASKRSNLRPAKAVTHTHKQTNKQTNKQTRRMGCQRVGLLTLQ